MSPLPGVLVGGQQVTGRRTGTRSTASRSAMAAAAPTGTSTDLIAPSPGIAPKTS